MKKNLKNIKQDDHVHSKPRRKKNGTVDFVFFLYILGKVNNRLNFLFDNYSTAKVELI